MGKWADAGLLLVLLQSSVWANNAAERQTVHLQDQNGKPLRHAVVEVIATRGSPLVSDADDKQWPQAVMDQVDKRFEPELLLVHSGQAVLFPNSDNIRHHVYSFSPSNPFELKLYSGRPKLPIVFQNPGVVVVGCNIHDAMVGYIYVSDAPHVALSDELGMVELPVSAEEILVWHPLQAIAAEQKTAFSLSPKTDQKPNTLRLTTHAPAPANTFQAQFRDAAAK